MTKWYVFTIDGLWDCFGDNNPYSKKQDALWDLTCACDDGRKRPKVKRLDQGCYEYTSPSYQTFFIATEKYILQNDYEWIFNTSLID